MEEFEIITSANDPAFSAHQEQAKSEARDALKDCDQYVLVTVKDGVPSRHLTVKPSNKQNWFYTLTKIIEHILNL